AQTPSRALHLHAQSRCAGEAAARPAGGGLRGVELRRIQQVAGGALFRQGRAGRGMNPEFQRNLWLELTPRRMGLMLVFLVLAFAAGAVSDGAGHGPAV